MEIKLAKAIWKGVILAQSDQCEIVERNYYFPPESVNRGYLKESDTHSACAWKGQANYYNIEVDGEINQDAAWYYPTPSDRASHIKDYVAFWKGVEVQKN